MTFHGITELVSVKFYVWNCFEDLLYFFSIRDFGEALLGIANGRFSQRSSDCFFGGNQQEFG